MSDSQGRSSELRQLEPSRPDPEELRGRPSYMPRIPWGVVAAFGSLLLLMVFGYQMRETQRTDALRSRIIDSYGSSLEPISERYMAFRERIERWTIDAGQSGVPERYVDPRLSISGLHSGQGIYLRVPERMTESAQTVAAGALAMREDAITRCLGIAPASVRGLYESGAFLDRSWLDEVRASSDFMRLRVIDEQLARSSEVDLPVVASLMSAQYFLLLVERGESRRDAPVDVFMWDLRSESALLRARVESNGVLLTVRSAFQGAPNGPVAPPAAFSAGAADCSIAAQIKALTGDAPIDVRSSEPPVAPASDLP